ncbi:MULTISPECIES: Hsp20/alpha crystallin family protein [Rhodococcus]|uniref:Hsp20/alpha crystallin family protein n=1 Tax=Rhodococcus TaxID=1827 RepID=UPI0002F4A792|nr:MULTISPECIES: Hsp20/alpha crystallin family protein [Rhodococcus]QQZ19674.1 Hsp20/alpha crystallin family protein [Rhodococcus sp. 21391]
MSILSPRRPHRSTMLTLAALPDWSDVVAGFESLPIWRPFENHLIRVEEHVDDDRYTLRAELPGVDPAKDIDISVRDGQLTITAERTEKQEEGTRSEFRYGSFYRSMPLPPGAQEDDINATYTDGILTVTVPVTESQTAEKHVEVTQGPAKEVPIDRGGKKS